MKQYVAFARVSSREQEREGFSLDVQEDALKAYAERNGGEIVQFYRIAETASKHDERKTFQEMVRYVKKNASKLAGMLFYKVDRAARNLTDYVDLERLESEYNIPFISVSQPTESTPAGRMQRRMLASMASFYTEQQSLDVKEGLKRRVEGGLFVGLPPYGYRNIRRDKRGLIEVHPERAATVRRIFELYAYHQHTLESLSEQLYEEGFYYHDDKPRFPVSVLHRLLLHRAYIGEVPYKGQWYEGLHEPLIGRDTWDRVAVLLGQKIYRSHELTYAGEMIACGHCGQTITGERKIKKTKKGEREYVYYRCAKYNRQGHPRIRMKESDLDAQMVGHFERMRIDDEVVRNWITEQIRKSANLEEAESKDRIKEINRQISLLHSQQSRLINMRMLDEIDGDTFVSTKTELRDREAKLELQLSALKRVRHEVVDLAIKAFELSQSLSSRWFRADHAEKRRIMEIVCLNFLLDGVSLCPIWRKPFEIVSEGLLVSSSRAERI